MFESFVFFAAGTNGGTGTLAIRVAKWCQDRQIPCVFCTNKITNKNNYISLIDTGAYVPVDDDPTYMKQYEMVTGSVKNALVIVYTLADYHKVEQIKKKNNNIKKILLYQVGFSPMAFCSYSSSNLKLKFKRLLLDIANKHYIEQLIKSNNLYIMDEQCKELMEQLLSIRVPEELILRLPYDFHIAEDININSQVPKIISTICRMDFPFKGYVIGLIKNFIYIADRNKDVQLFIVGNGAGKDQVNALVDTISDDIKSRIHLLGSVPYEKIGDILKHTTLYVGMGTTILDAVQYNCLAVVVAANTMDLETEGLFVDHPTNLGYSAGKYQAIDFEKLVTKVFDLSNDDYINFAHEQQAKARSVYDIDVFMSRLNALDTNNYLLSDSYFWNFRFSISQNLSKVLNRIMSI